MSMNSTIDSTLPSAGKSFAEVMGLVREARRRDPAGARGRMTMFGMTGTDELRAVSEEAHRAFFHYNGMPAGRLASYSLTELQSEVLATGIAILGGGSEAREAFTSGGSESNFLALHAIREWARQERGIEGRPQIVAPYSAHPTIDKAAHYLGLDVVRVPLGDDLRGDPVAVESAIGDRTAGIVGSAVCWSYGLFDPIPEFAAIARRHSLWLHVDASVGGWIARFVRDAGYDVPQFDLSAPGVDSSADLYEYTMFRFDDWPGGPYVTAGATGSRPGGAIASAWAVINFLGHDGYIDLARRTMQMKQHLAEGLRSIDGIDAWDTDLVLKVYGSTSLDVGAIAKELRDQGHSVIGTTTPPLIHLQCDTIDHDIVDAYVQDVAVAAARVRSGEATDTVAVGYM
jgi:sphinganine-1-phosphate aldolase